MVAGICTTTWNRRNWTVWKLIKHVSDYTGTSRVAYFDRRDFDSSGVPSRPLPAFDTHGAEAQQTDSSVALTHLYTMFNLDKNIQETNPSLIGRIPLG